MNRRKERKFFAVIITVLIMLMVPLKTFAAESITVPAEDTGQEIVSVDFPTLQEEESPFDFIIDPQNLLFETGASLYGGGNVEEDANLLFHNRAEGEYDFSRYSDKLTVTNRSTIPVRITISAQITDTDDMRIVQDKNFPEDGLNDIYLALVDDEGNEQPISGEGEVSICARMQKAPEDVSTDDLTAEADNYKYSLSDEGGDTGFDTYSFGLTGECNPDADWSSISVHPKIIVTWHVEPILTEQEEKTEEDEQLAKDMRKDDLNKDNLNEDDLNEDGLDESGLDESGLDEDSLDEDMPEEGSTKENVTNQNAANEDIDHKDLEIKKKYSE